MVSVSTTASGEGPAWLVEGHLLAVQKATFSLCLYKAGRELPLVPCFWSPPSIGPGAPHAFIQPYLPPRGPIFKHLDFGGQAAVCEFGGTQASPRRGFQVLRGCVFGGH